jgi:membrane-bound lytic murein transglycosylase D
MTRFPALRVSALWIIVTYYVTWSAGAAEAPAGGGPAETAGRAEAGGQPVTPAGPGTEAGDWLRLGRELFDQLAPPEVKAQYEFPTPEQWEVFLGRLQRALAGDSLAEFGALDREVRSALTLLRTVPGQEDLAAWLEQRLDESEAAQLVVAPPTPPPVGPRPPLRPGTPRPATVQPVPHYNLWLERVRLRPLPARAGELVPRLQAAFVAEGVPAELVWLAEAESSLNPTARSPVGAKGLFQFMPETARAMGLRTFLPDERTDPDRSARAAARYLRSLHGRFGNWALALAAYNAGEGRVSRTLAAKRASTFTAIADALPAETRMYVPKVCALIASRAGVTPDRIAAPR